MENINQNQTPSKFGELRKIHPNMGKRWAKEEDEKLKKLYEERRAAGFGATTTLGTHSDFDVFVLELTKEFGRAAGGIKARLAMHFTDVPGWDYGRADFRKEELNKKTAEAIDSSRDDFLRKEYQKYLEKKSETYLSFLKRISDALGGVKGELVRHRLEQLVGEVEKLKRDDVLSEFGSYSHNIEEPEIPKLDLENNPQMRQALEIMEQGSGNLFLTGEAGTGKSTLLRYFRHTTEKNVVVLAPTGVAALNVEGQTIHSFCAFGPDITLSKVKKLGPWAPKAKLLKNLQTIVIDEISMVRADPDPPALPANDFCLDNRGSLNQRGFLLSF